jgi:hypothetical protein
MQIVQPKVSFIDAQQMSKDHPDTFEAPDANQLAVLQVGDIVKVCPGSERFWAEIKEIEGSTITAVVDNDLIYTEQHGLQLGDYIQFEKQHIYNIY